MPWWKRLIFFALTALLVLGAVELMAKGAGSIIAGSRFSATRLQERRDALIASTGRVALGTNVRWGRDELLHPYVGYVPGQGDAANLLGAAGAPLPRRAADRVILAVVGGSVAQLFAEQGLPRLIEHLSGLDAFRGRMFVPMNLAVGGYKQPQQFMTISYLLAQGAEFDVVINLDGFNDVTMHPAENAAHGVPLAYPRRWDQRVEGLFQGGTLRLMLRRVLTEQRRARLAEAFSRFPWRALSTTNLIYLALDRALESEQAAIDRQMMGGPAREPSTTARTRAGSAGDERMYKDLADLWQRSSLQLARLAEASGARYYHFLQPNQYVVGSKPLTAGERAEAWIADHPYRRAVEAGYPSLQRAGRTLLRLGVRFTDLSGAFGDHPEPIYIDSCCHVNRRGNAILADLMFQAMRRDLAQAGRR
ncbi:MAG: hypothetical protein ACREK9_03625 [Candidatus Rokuibacteriota bacterium]